MTKQLAKREPQEWIEYVLERFNSHLISEEEACRLLRMKRASLYKIRQRWLKCVISNTPFKLTSSGQNQKLSLTAEVENFLVLPQGTVVTKPKSSLNTAFLAFHG